jgi:hypothetical protein
MKSVTFVKAWDMYFDGDSASFETVIADKLIAAGIAKEYEAPAVDKKAKADKF